MTNKQLESTWRFRLGVSVFVLSFCSPLLIPLVAASALSTELKTVFSGTLAAYTCE